MFFLGIGHTGHRKSNIKQNMTTSNDLLLCDFVELNSVEDARLRASYARQFFNIHLEWISRLVFIEEADLAMMNAPHKLASCLLAVLRDNRDVVVGSVCLKEQPFDVHAQRQCTASTDSAAVDADADAVSASDARDGDASAADSSSQPRSFELLKFAVSPSYQKCGIGKELLRRSLARAAELNATQLVLWSESHLYAAQKLYVNYGFEQVSIEDVHNKTYEGADVKFAKLL